MSRPTAISNSKEIAELRFRVDQLQREVILLRRRLQTNGENDEPWWETIAGHFDNDPIFEQVVAEGRKWRESQRPKTTARRARS